MIARMWESRIKAGELDAFCAWARDEVWPQLVEADGFLGGEVYRSPSGAERAVVVTRWTSMAAMASANEWFDLGAERYLEAGASAWEFTPVDLTP